MAKQKKNVLYIMSLAFAFLLAGILIGCGPKQTAISYSGNGQVVESVDEDGTKSYTAVADEWNDFLGWYNGEELYSDSKTIVIDGNSPEKLVALFASNGEISIDRFLDGVYKQISSKDENNYFNYTSQFDFNVNQGGENFKYTLDMNGSLSLDGEQNLLDINLKDEENLSKLSINLKNYGQKTSILLKIDENECYYELPFEFQNISFPNQTPTLQNILGEDYSSVNQLLGHQNSLSLIEDVQNTSRQTKITFRLDKLLEYVKNVILPNVAESDVFVKELLETFTKKYQGLSRTLPKMKLSFVIDYTEAGLLQNISGTFNLEEDYKLELEETVTIKAFSSQFNCINFEFAYGDAPSLQWTETSLSKIEVANISLGGEVDFLYENSVTFDKEIIDKYSISLHTDVNPFAFENAIEKGNINWNKIDWENFGYLSFAMSLVEVDGDEGQIARHNGEVDYVNVIIDSSKFGANMLVYSGLYNPKMNLVSENYLLNNAFYLPALMSTYAEGLNDAFPESQQVSLKLVVEALKGTIAYIINNDNESLNDVVYNFLSTMLQLDSTQEIQENLFTEEGKIILKTAKIKEIISQSLTEVSSWIGYSNFTSNMFGSATHLAFNITSLEYGKIDQTIKDSDLALYNQKHPTLISIASEISGIDDVDFSAVDDYNMALKEQIGKEKQLRGIFSDGSESQTFDDYKTAGQNIVLTVYDIQVVEEGEKEAKIIIFFTYSQGTLASTLYNKNIPYGLIACEKTIAI
ncbi:MAG: hypothetical protein IJZ62_05595 [Clostridia bacterium]|nr:hypothetical protein [Clostridia bacterium]